MSPAAVRLSNRAGTDRDGRAGEMHEGRPVVRAAPEDVPNPQFSYFFFEAFFLAAFFFAGI